ncbi:MAG: hypothetical protein CMA59_01180 [Euryarchaeota archaeon]|nr:hypothetical protein [Euryarchaeota archaeon]
MENLVAIVAQIICCPSKQEAGWLPPAQGQGTKARSAPTACHHSNCGPRWPRTCSCLASQAGARGARPKLRAATRQLKQQFDTVKPNVKQALLERPVGRPSAPARHEHVLGHERRVLRGEAHAATRATVAGLRCFGWHRSPQRARSEEGVGVLPLWSHQVPGGMAAGACFLIA